MNKRIIIPLKEGITYQEINPLIRRLQGHLIRTFKYLPYVVVQIPEANLQVFAENEIAANYFEDGEVHTLEQLIPWGVSRIEADKVHSRNGVKGYGIKVAVIDTGIDLNHPDLKVYGGISYVTPTYQDDNGHGTHVAGTIAAMDNGEGVVGVAPEAQLFALKALNSKGSGNYSDIAAAMEWCIDNGMDIISMSFGGSSSNDLLKSAVIKVFQAGILLIAAAGNSGNSAGTGVNVSYPANYPEVIAVAATESNDTRASFSSTGPAVEIAAPGANILSTYYNSGYQTLSGTSMATPHVSGLAALIKCAYPSLSNRDIRKKICDSAIDLGVTGRDSWYGYGLISAPAAVLNPEPDTAPPELIFISPDNEKPVSGIVKIEVSAKDPSGVNNLKLLIDQELMGQWSSPPYIYYWDSTGVQPGVHNLTAEAVDGVGNVGQATEEVNVEATVTLLEPQEGMVVKDIITVQAAFSTNGSVTKSQLYVDGILKETKEPVNNQVEYSWDSREVRSPGTSNHIIKVTALNDQGLNSAGTVNVIMRNPVVTLVEPEGNILITDERLKISAHATDSHGIEKVEFYVDSLPIGTLFSEPFRVDFNASNLAAGNHGIKSIAYCKKGHGGESREIFFQKPAGISFISPRDGAIIDGKTIITLNFTDPVSKAEVFIDDFSLGATEVTGIGPVSWTFDTIGYPNLTAVAIKVKAYTIKDEVLSTGRITVTIDNYQDETDEVPPQVGLKSSQTGIVDGVVILTAEITDHKGVEKVEFFINGMLVLTKGEFPYEFQWDSSRETTGNYTFLAKAYDFMGNLGVSNPVNLAVPTKVSIISPPDGSCLSGEFYDFKASFVDPVIGSVDLYIDGEYKATSDIASPTSGPVIVNYLWDTKSYPNGSIHEIIIKAYPALGAVVSFGSVKVTVQN